MDIQFQSADFGDGRVHLKFEREGPMPLAADNPLSIVLREALGRDSQSPAPFLIHEIVVNSNSPRRDRRRTRRLKA